MRAAAVLAAIVLVSGCGASEPPAPPMPSPQAVADELLAADRAFSDAASNLNVVDGLTAMFRPDVLVPGPGGVFLEGPDAVKTALQANPDNAAGRAQWTPVRAGVSADGQHGFTWGFMTVTKPDGSTTPWKYLAYWIKGPDGWRVAGYKRRPRPDGIVASGAVAPALPSAIVAPTSDAAVVEQHRASLTEAEAAFSRDAQTMGLGPAFEHYGSEDAMNMGGPEDVGFVVGSVTIGRNVGAGLPPNTSPLEWAADHRTLVASSGDLGVTFGFIRAKNPGPDGKPQPPAPFFTVWRRPSPSMPWRYVAE